MFLLEKWTKEPKVLDENDGKWRSGSKSFFFGDGSVNALEPFWKETHGWEYHRFDPSSNFR